MESKFDGKLLGLIGISILEFLIIVLTLGIGTPWAVCVRERWIAEHTTIEGNRLVFKGRGIRLLGNMIKWTFLSIITLGIYSLWVGIKLKQWIVKNTYFLEEE